MGIVLRTGGACGQGEGKKENKKKNLGIHTPLSLASAGDKAIALPEVVP